MTYAKCIRQSLFGNGICFCKNEDYLRMYENVKKIEIKYISNLRNENKQYRDYVYRQGKYEFCMLILLCFYLFDSYLYFIFGFFGYLIE